MECRECGKRKPLDEFETVNAERGWRRRVCKACRADKFREWAQRSKDHIRAYRRQYHADNRETIIAKVNKWVADNPDKRKKNALAYYYRLQFAAIQAYGGYRCACCGETEPLFLTLDHTNNDGAARRRELGFLGGARLYEWLRDNGYPKGFQVLCMNCNQGRHRNGGTCPHKQGVTTIPKGSRPKRAEAHRTRQRVMR